MLMVLMFVQSVIFLNLISTEQIRLGKD